MATMRAVQVSRANGPFELVERPVPNPGAGTVRVKVEACGICHSDTIVKQGLLPFAYPRVPGHEVAGVIDALGAGVTGWTVGQRVGVGWNGGYDGVCAACRRGEFFACVTRPVTGISFDGGYADYLIAPASALAAIPPELSFVEAAPLMCAGVTMFTALRSAGARPGDLVAVFGLGGLGHLGVQLAAKMGFRTVAIARGADKEELARKLGAWRYLDSKATEIAAGLQKLGGAKAVISTVTDGPAMASTVGGLAPNGSLMVVGAAGEMTVSPLALLFEQRSIRGVYSGVSSDSEATMAFSALTGVRPMNEIYPLERVAEAYERMLNGTARFRSVLAIGGTRAS
jgi:D-arabinose 1-dehydrogenase-like Zn-dependent alcohol dehydrogenase